MKRNWNSLATVLMIFAAGGLLAVTSLTTNVEAQIDQSEIDRKLAELQQDRTGPPPNRRQGEGRQGGGNQVLPPELLEELFRGLDEDVRRQREANMPDVHSIDREREANRNERSHRAELRMYAGALAEVHASIVRIESDREQIVLGTIVSDDGYLVTKASELINQDNLICVLADGERLVPEIVTIRDDYDLALLKIDRDDLMAIDWASEIPPVGTIVAVGNETGEAVSAGVVSVEPRALINSNQAVLGVIPQPADEGVLMSEVVAGTAAANAGIRANDIVLSIDDVQVDSVNGFTNRIRLYEPGETIELEVRRGSREFKVEAELGGRSLSNPFAQGMDASRFGSEPSRRRSDFPLVLQHDAHLWPEQCGGPLVDLDGQAIGLNIARGDRVSSLAIPAAEAAELIAEMLEQTR